MWLSQKIRKDPETKQALRELSKLIREYSDATKITNTLPVKIERFFKPSATIYFISVIIATATIASFYYMGRFNWKFLQELLKISLTISTPIFVLGISLSTAATSLNKESRFAAEYLKDSCNTIHFAYLAFLTVTMGTLYYIAKMFNCELLCIIYSSFSIGGTVWCLCSLAYIIAETTRCMQPEFSTKAAANYAARKLTLGFLKDAYTTLLKKHHKSCLSNWCAGKAICSPEQYYGHYYKSGIYSGSGNNDIEIELNRNISKKPLCADYNFKGLEKLERFLRKNNAKLYLDPNYDNDKKKLGILSSVNVKANKDLQLAVSRKGAKIVKYQKYKFVEESENFWDSQESKLNETVKKTIEALDPIQMKAYLDAVNVPFSVLGQMRKKHKIIRDAYGEYVQNGYRFLSLYLKVLRKISVMKEEDQIYNMAYKVFISIWEETRHILRDMDYHTMGLYTWIVPQIYSLIQDNKKANNKLQDMRGKFGGFYEFAGGWLDDTQSKNTEDADKMRQVLYEGLTQWLMTAIKHKDDELVEQLCDAVRKIVFGRDSIKFEHNEVVTRHFILAGHLIDLVKSEKIKKVAIERLFCERHLHEPDINLEELVQFYIENSVDLDKLNSYLRTFSTPTKTQTNLLTGSSFWSGFGMMGSREMSLAFIFITAYAITEGSQLPAPTAQMSERMIEENIKVVKGAFNDHSLDYGLNELEGWIKGCEQLNEAKEAKEIAEAKLDDEKVKEHEKKFWGGYSSETPVISMCLKNGNYQIDNNTENKLRYIVPKIALFDWKIPISGADGDTYGLDCGRKMEGDLLKKIIIDDKAKSKIKSTLPEAIKKAANWLERKGCTNDNGIIITASNKLPQTEMYQEKDFIPSWKEEVKALGFDGFFRGFPIKRFWNDEKSKNENQPCQKVVAIDFRDWIGLNVRKEVVSEHKFGELKIREWTNDEIKRAIKSKKLAKEDVNKAKGNCPVDITFFWEPNKSKLPEQMEIILEENNL